MMSLIICAQTQISLGQSNRV